MQIKINTDNNIQGDERLKDVARGLVEQGLGHVLARLTRVEVHLQDENAHKGGSDDIRCMIEARPEGLAPQAATHNDADIEAAVRGAAKKLRNLLESEFGKLDPRRATLRLRRGGGPGGGGHRAPPARSGHALAPCPSGPVVPSVLRGT